MYNIRRKLWILTALLFVVSVIMLKVFPKRNAEDVIAAHNNATEQTAGNVSDVFNGGGERFVAHRGYSNYAPENSIPAFELAGRVGFWGIETDISQTNDGKFVCMHDDDLDRTTDGTGEVGEYSLEQIEQFTIDWGNYLKRSENLKIPTFEEYLEICKQYGCVAVVEIKHITDFDTFLNIILSSGLETKCIITGSINDVKEIRARNTFIPVMTIGYCPAPYTDNLTYIADIPENRGILYNYPQVDGEAINMLHQQGIYCGVWSVDETAAAQTYIEYGADFIVTNEIPARLEHMLNENE